MAVAAKVIGAVRLGLVDMKVLIHELNTSDMQRLPDIHMILFDAAIYFHVPSQVPRHLLTNQASSSKPGKSSVEVVMCIPTSECKTETAPDCRPMVKMHTEGIQAS